MSETEKLAKVILKSAQEVQFVVTIITCVMLFGLGALLLYLIGLWLAGHMQVIVAVGLVYAACIILALSGVE
jgi:fatty acid desaturase